MTIFYNSCLADSAPGPWNEPKVPEDVAAHVWYSSIADDEVKTIDIQECGEELVDLDEIANPRIVSMSLFGNQYKADYSGYAKIRKSLYEKLVKMLTFLPFDVGIAYSEGFRPITKQKEYFDKKFTEILKTLPDKNQAFKETSKHVSSLFIEDNITNVPTHATGAAIDMTLFKMKDAKKYLMTVDLMDLGKFDVISGPNNQQETFSPNTTMEQRKNRLLLLTAAVKSGFVNYGYEWWHYSYGDKVYAKVTGQKYAIYGLATDKDDIKPITREEYLSQVK